MKKTFGAIALALTMSACAGPQYYVSPGQKAFLPSKGPGQTTGIVTVLPDQPVFQTPVVFRRAAKLGAPVEIAVAGKAFTLVAGDVLSAASIAGRAGDNVPVGAQVFCGTAQSHIGKSLVGFTSLGLSSLVNRTGNVTQLCVYDSEVDGKLDKALLVGVKKDADAVPVSIGPVPYERVTDELIPGRSLAQIVYRGKTGMLGGHVSFDLQVVENGVPLFFNNVRTTVNIKDLPKPVELMGTRFVVKSYDPATGATTLDVERGFVEGNYGITVQYTTRTIPIYIPG